MYKCPWCGGDGTIKRRAYGDEPGRSAITTTMPPIKCGECHGSGAVTDARHAELLPEVLEIFIAGEDPDQPGQLARIA